MKEIDLNPCLIRICRDGFLANRTRSSPQKSERRRLENRETGKDKKLGNPRIL